MKARWGAHRLGTPGFKRRVQVRVVELYGGRYVRSKNLVLHGLRFERVWLLLWQVLRKRVTRSRGPK